MTGIRRTCIGIVLVLLWAAALAGAAEKPRTVDSGAFGVFLKGQRIATEHFQIQQGSAFSTATSDFKLENGDTKAAQRSELQITPSGDLRRYEWRELSPGKAQVVIEPADQFLIEHITPNPPERPMEQPFMVPLSTMVLDDYFFSQREILAWRYLAQACNGNVMECKPGRLQFGVLVPQQRTSALVTLEATGQEKAVIHGRERELNRLSMKIDEVEWLLYLDTDLKLQRIVIPSEQTEVVRD